MSEFRAIPSAPGYSIARDGTLLRHARAGQRNLSEKIMRTGADNVQLADRSRYRPQLVQEAWADVIESERIADEKLSREDRLRRNRPKPSFRGSRTVTIGEFREWLRSRRITAVADDEERQDA